MSKIRSEKSLNIKEASLHTQSINTTSLKFNSQLDATEGDPATRSKLNMKAFLQLVGDIVECFGLGNFFYLPDSDKMMKYLPNEPCNFNVTSVMGNHISTLAKPAVVDDTSVNKTPSFTMARYR